MLAVFPPEVHTQRPPLAERRLTHGAAELVLQTAAAVAVAAADVTLPMQRQTLVGREASGTAGEVALQGRGRVRGRSVPPAARVAVTRLTNLQRENGGVNVTITPFRKVITLF